MKMKKSIPCLFILLLQFVVMSGQAQSNIALHYSGSGGLTLNEVSIHNMSKDKVVEILGKPDREEVSKSGEISYFYDKHGIVFFIQNETVKGLGVNYKWDGDKKFPETSYTGTMLIGDLEVTGKTQRDELTANESVGFICPIPLMCAVKDKTVDVKCMVSFREDQLSQFVFIWD